MHLILGNPNWWIIAIQLVSFTVRRWECDHSSHKFLATTLTLIMSHSEEFIFRIGNLYRLEGGGGKKNNNQELPGTQMTSIFEGTHPPKQGRTSSLKTGGPIWVSGMGLGVYTLPWLKHGMLRLSLRWPFQRRRWNGWRKPFWVERLWISMRNNWHHPNLYGYLFSSASDKILIFLLFWGFVCFSVFFFWGGYDLGLL